MKKIAALTLLSAALAACGQTNAPTAHTAPGIASTYARSLTPGGVTLQDLQAKLDAQGEAGIDAISAQVLAPQVYLNVLKIAGSDSVRAYLKSTFASPVTCALDWGDASNSTPFASPTTLRIDTRDHTYAAFGTYAVAATCMNNGTVVGSRTFTVQAGRRSSTFDLESPVASADSYTYVGSLHSQGYSMVADNNFLPIWSGSQPTTGIGSDGSQAFDPVYRNTITRDNGAPFSLSSFDYLNFSRGNPGVTVLLGTRADTSTVILIVNGTDLSQTATLGSDWRNMIRIEINPGNDTGTPRNLIDNITLSN